jgi:hypothetical protein
MANAQAFELGWQGAREALEHRRERKEMLADEERKVKISDLFDKGHRLSALIPSLAGDDRAKAVDTLTNIESDIRQIYHPDHNPGALQKDWHWLEGLIRRPKPAAPVLQSSTTQAATPATTVTLPGQAQSFRVGEQQINIPAALTTNPVALDATPPAKVVSIRRDALTPDQRQRMQGREQARQRAEQDVMASGELSPQQESTRTLALMTQAVKDFKAMKPGATAQEQVEFVNRLIDQHYGFAADRPVYKEFTSPDGSKQFFDVSRPDLIPSGWSATGSGSADERKRADYAEFKRLHPDYAGTFEQWAVEQGQLARRAVPSNRDDRFIDIEQRRALGQPVSADDQAYSAAWDLYVNKRVIAPGVARAAAFAADRFVQVVDPSDPEKVIFMPAGVAARAGAGTPASIGYKTDAAVSKFMTSGAGAQNIAAFNTATDHLELLGEAADALNNGDFQRLNQVGNTFARETGSPAPSNFGAVKSAVAGELSKVFKGTGATDQEISEINSTLNSAMSPDQLHGAIDYYTRLMGGKLNALRSQYEAGRSGRPAFPTNTPKGGGGPAASKGARSIGAAMKLWQDKGEPKTEPWVIEDLKKHGYVPIRP